MTRFVIALTLCLSACSTPTLFLAEQGQPEQLQQNLRQLLAAQKWQVEEFSNRIDPPRIDSPMLIYGVDSDLATLKVALELAGLPETKIIFVRARNHRVSENNAVLYFPVSDNKLIQRFVFTVSCGDVAHDVYTFDDFSARIQSSRWDAKKSAWRATAQALGRWQMRGQGPFIGSNDESLQWQFVLDPGNSPFRQWILDRTDRHDSCDGYIWHEAF